MCDAQNRDTNSPTSSDCDEENLIQLTRVVKRWWEDDSFEKTQSRYPARLSGRDPDHEIAFKRLLMLQDKIQSRDSKTWNWRGPEHNMALREIRNIQEEAQYSSNGVLKKRRVQCYICLKKFIDKDALRIHRYYVHLRKMYKCTVEGCFRVFYSKALWNRHSYIHHK